MIEQRRAPVSALAALLFVPACSVDTGVEPVPEVDLAISELSVGSVTLHPAGMGNWVTFRAHGCPENVGEWQCVNDQPGDAVSGTPAVDDGDATRLTIGAAGGGKGKQGHVTRQASFSLDASAVPAGAEVHTLVITARVGESRKGGQDPAVRLFHREHLGDDVHCGEAVPVSGETYMSVSCTFAVTDVPEEIGVEETAGNDLKVTQVYAEVQYSQF